MRSTWCFIQIYHCNKSSTNSSALVPPCPSIFIFKYLLYFIFIFKYLLHFTNYHYFDGFNSLRNLNGPSHLLYQAQTSLSDFRGSIILPFLYRIFYFSTAHIFFQSDHIYHIHKNPPLFAWFILFFFLLSI